MKKLFTILAVAAAMVSCAKEDVVSVNREAIGFDNAFVDNATRSVETPGYSTTNLFNDFAVYGFVEGASVFNGIKVSKGGDIQNTELKKDWKYSGTQYWIAGANYDFYAVAPFTGNWKIKDTTTPTDAGAIITFTNENGTQDLLYSGIIERQGAESNNAAVAFNFKHILSKVKFSFKNGYNASAATICVRDIKITNAYATGDATLAATATASWDNFGGDIDIAFGNATDNQETGDVKEGVDVDYAYGKTYESYYERFVIPANNTWTISFVVDLMVSGQKIKTYNHTATATINFLPGQAYDILAEITAANIDPTTSQEPIEFTATMNDWTTAEDKTADIVDNTPQQGNN